MGSRIGIVGLLLVGVAASAWWWLARDAGEGAVVPETGPDAALHEPESREEAPSHVAGAREGELHATDAAPSVDHGEPAPPQASLGEERETWTLWGFVRDEATNNPCPAYRVISTDGLDALCNENGRFEFEIPFSVSRPGNRRLFHVYSPEGARVATQRVVLEPGVVFYVDRVVVLYGRVVDALGRPVPADSVVASEPGDRAFASGEVAEHDSTFRLAVGAASVAVEVLELEFTVGRFSFDVFCPTAELTSPAGANVVLDLCDVRVRVRDAEGAPLPQVGLRMLARRPNAREVTWVQDLTLTNFRNLQLDAEGCVDVTLERGLMSVTLEVGLHEHVPWFQTLPGPPCGTIWDVTMQRVRPDDEIRGRVLSPKGDPVGPIQVEATPIVDDPVLREALFLSLTIADEDGNFVLPLPQGVPCRLQASHRDFGRTALEPVVAGDHDVELRFPAVRRVTLDLFSATGGPLPVSEPSSFCWLVLDDGESFQTQGTLQVVELSRVPVGRHLAYVLAGEPGLFGAVDVHVTADRDVHLDVTMRPSHSTTGRVLDADGRPLHSARVRPLDGRWSQHGGQPLFSTRSRADGWFHVFLADRSEGEVEISYEGRDSLRVQVQADTPATWTLP